MNLLTSFVSRVIAVLLQAVLLLAGLVFVASLVAVGLLIALVSIVAALLLGKKPVLRASFATNPRAAWSRFRPGGMGRTAAAKPAGEVIDIEAREVTPVLDAKDANVPR